MISYAQNFEDVILWRVLGFVEKGFYIDVGAQDPVLDSVSRAFYDAGWRGVHVEPSPNYAEKLRAARPDETVLEWAVGAKEGKIQFFHFPDTGLSTGIQSIADHHAANGYRVESIEREVKPTAVMLEAFADRDIHWMKVDCEGMEAPIIEGWQSSSVRPWIVVVESTYPGTQNPVYDEWEPQLLALGYSFVYFDGLNRFYVSNAKPELAEKFGPGPNCFDSFMIAPVHGVMRDVEREIAAQQGALAVARRRVADENELLSGGHADRKGLLTQIDQRVSDVLQHQQSVSLGLSLQMQRVSDQFDAAAAQSKARLTEITKSLAAERVARDSAQKLLTIATQEKANFLTDMQLLRMELMDVQQQLIQAQAASEAAHQEINALRASTSWRITAPVREFKTVMRGIRRGKILAAEVLSEQHKPSDDHLNRTISGGIRGVHDFEILGSRSPLVTRAEEIYAEITTAPHSKAKQAARESK